MAEATAPTTTPPAKKAAASRTKKTAAAQCPDVIDAMAAALAAPEDDAEHQKVAAYLDGILEERAAEQSVGRPRNVIEAITAVMREVSHVTKEDRNSHGNFNFRGIDATVNALGPAFRKIGLVVRPELLDYKYGDVVVGQNRTQQAHAQVKVRYHFHYSNPDGDLSSIAAEVPGEAMDSGDKATAKAMSVAMRIALLQTFALPTTEPDPDAYSYERAAPPTTTVNDVYAATGWAAKEEDFAAAFKLLRERFGADLFSLTLRNAANEEVRADKYLDMAEAKTAEFRAQQAVTAQDTAATAPEPDARTEEAPVRADAQPADAQDARTEDPAPAQEPARTEAPPTETNAQKMQRLALAELEFQADVLSVQAAEYAANILSTPGDLTSLIPPRTPRWLIEQRPQVIAVLRDQGRATEAEAYERVGEGFPMLMEKITEADAEARERAASQG